MTKKKPKPPETETQEVSPAPEAVEAPETLSAEPPQVDAPQDDKPRAPGRKGGRPSNAFKEFQEARAKTTATLSDQFDKINAQLKVTPIGDLSAGAWERDTIVGALVEEMAAERIDISPRALAGVAIASWAARGAWIYYQHKRGIHEPATRQPEPEPATTGNGASYTSQTQS